MTWSTHALADQIGFGVYVHVPFCRHKCDYCVFATFADRPHLESQYLAALRTEIDRAAPSLPKASSIFVGGGTPSHVDARGNDGAARSISVRSAARYCASR